MSLETYAPHGLVAVGLAVMVASVLSGSPVPLVPETAFVVGIFFVLLGAAWLDARQRADDGDGLAFLLGPFGRALYGSQETTTKDWAFHVAGLVGMVLLLVFMADTPLPGLVETVLSVVGLALLLGAAYWNRHGRAVQSYDERQLYIRYRAAYVALWVVGTLLGGVVLLGNAIMRPEGERGLLAFALVAAAAVPLFTGLLAFKVAEGYYEQQM